MDFAHSTAKAMATKDVAGMLEQLDADGDGYLSLQEHLATSGGEGEGDTQDPLVLRWIQGYPNNGSFFSIVS